MKDDSTTNSVVSGVSTQRKSARFAALQKRASVSLPYWRAFVKRAALPLYLQYSRNESKFMTCLKSTKLQKLVSYIL